MKEIQTYEIDEKTKIMPAFQKNNIPVCLFSSDAYAPYCGVLLCSLIENSKPENNYDIIILNRNISENNKRLMSNLIKDRVNFSVRFLDATQLADKFSVNTHGHFALESCLKLLLMSDIFENYDKFVTTDSDLVFCNDVADLYKTELGDTYMAAVDDVIMKLLVYKEHLSGGASKAPKIPSGEYITDYLGMPSSDIYFNTGVVVLNLSKCREDNLFDLAFEKVNSREYWFLEQDVLNEICGANATLLDFKWNVLNGNGRLDEIKEILSEEVYEKFSESLNDYYVMHFAGVNKPWLVPDIDYSDVFYKYAKNSPWYEKIVFDMHAKYVIRTSQKTCDKYFRISTLKFEPKHKYSGIKGFFKRIAIFWVNIFFPENTERRAKIKNFYVRLKDKKRKESFKEIASRNKTAYKNRRNKNTEHYINYQSIISFKNKYQGKRCFIVGTGPSLRLDDLEKISGEYTFSLNSIYKLFDKTDWRPTFYITNDIMLDYKMTLPQSERKEELFACLENYKFRHCFISSSPFNDEIRKIYKENISFLPVQDYLYQLSQPELPYFGKDIAKKCQAYGTTVYLIFQIAVYMGFSEIYLIGTDCSYTGASHHAYESESDKILYGNRARAISLEKALRKGFDAISYYAGKRKYLSVFNATRGGKLELLPRKSLDRVLDAEKKLIMNIGYISSNEYAPLMGISMFSLFDHNKDADEINVFIFSVHIDESNKEKIRSVAKEFKRNVNFVEKNDEMDKIAEDNNLTIFNGISSTYVKILPHIFFDGIDKILMLDSDTIINQSLAPLYDVDLTDKYVAAVPEITALYRSSEDPSVISKNSYYYNTGVLLFNLKKMREDKFEEKLFAAFRYYRKPLKLADQSLLNLTISDTDVASLHFKYNYNCNLSIFSDIREKVLKQYADEGLGFLHTNYKHNVDAKKIAIIHYIGAFRPWIKWRFAPYGKYYKRYWKKSLWKNNKRRSRLDEMKENRIAGNPKSIAAIPLIGKTYLALAAVCERFFYVQYNKHRMKVLRKK